MKKVIYASLFGAALIVQPVSAADTYTAARVDDAATSGVALSTYARAESFVADKALAAFDRIFSPAYARAATIKPDAGTANNIQLAANAHARVARQHELASSDAVITQVDTSADGDASERPHWMLFPAALLLMGFIVRRRTAVR